MNPKSFEKRLINFDQASIVDFDVSLRSWNTVFLLESKDPDKPNQRVILVSPELFYATDPKPIARKSNHVREEIEIINRAMGIGFCLMKKSVPNSEFFSLLEEEGSLTIYEISRQTSYSKTKKAFGSSAKEIGSYQFVV